MENTAMVLLDKYLLEQQVKESKIARTSHHPSSSCCRIDGKFMGECLRQQYYKWKATPQSNPPNLPALYKMWMGRVIHEAAEKIIMEVNPNIKTENNYRVQDELLEYMIDGTLDVVEPGVKFHDIKTVYSTGMRVVQATGIPKLEALLQMTVYCYLSGVNHTVVWYIARDTGYCLEFECDYTPRGLKVYDYQTPYTIEAILEGWKEFETYLTADKLPPKCYEVGYSLEKIKELHDEYLETSIAKKKQTLQTFSTDKQGNPKGDWQCSYCGWKDICSVNV